MGNAQKALVMAAGIFLAIALITIGVVLFISAQEATKTAQNNFSDIQTELSQTAYTVYDNTVISGNQVTNALRKYNSKEQFGIQIKTGKNTDGSWYKNEVTLVGDDYGNIVGEKVTVIKDINVVNDEKSAQYVNPSGKFKSKIIRDKSNVIRGIIFEQQTS
ncbi:ABC transporter permease [Paenibacillus sp. N1-5-1-14]|uniref:ABC transporter permease n=1 Tax=Paenibacillus radicibacter TaxID=2972488 RepID=UPI002158EC39|nr:ABC transporter permease [Paenibacillus radicibacter]MCR8642101.1 ABC transporter permease [Paenibacillus radicibacter]